MPGIRAFLWVFLSFTVVAAALTTELPAPAAAAPGAEPAATLRLGIIDDPDNPQQTEVLKESAEALRKALPGLRIELSALGELELQKAVLDRKIDMYMLSAGFHAYVADLGGADLIAALKPPLCISAERRRRCCLSCPRRRPGALEPLQSALGARSRGKPRILQRLGSGAPRGRERHALPGSLLRQNHLYGRIRTRRD